MAKESPGIGHNLTEIKKKVQFAISSVKDLKAERAETNAGIANIRASMEALGIKKAAFDMAMRYLEWEPEKREGFDLAYAIVREAGGLPMAEDLFAAAERLEKEAAEKAAETAKQTDADAVFAKKAKGPDAAGMAKVMQ